MTEYVPNIICSCSDVSQKSSKRIQIHPKIKSRNILSKRGENFGSERYKTFLGLQKGPSSQNLNFELKCDIKKIYKMINTRWEFVRIQICAN